ncbi:hypothetical protein [Clostridium chromiireducens]|nr:hypothetical protein [Clostridium chromiireducens]
MQLQLKYKTDAEKDKMIKILLASATVKKISNPYRSGKFYRIYLDVE